MSQESAFPKLLFVVGPTASGKSELAIKLAQDLKSEIANCDSLQIYRELNIGTAKPTLAMRRLVPHHLFDLADPGEIFTAGDYRRAAVELLQAGKQRNLSSLLFTGGSGFYIRALLQGMYDLPKSTLESQTQVEAIWQTIGADGAYQKIKNEDPVYAEKLNANDFYRLKRALEIHLLTGKTVSQIQLEFRQKEAAASTNFSSISIGLRAERSQLRRRISERTQAMLREGFVEEVEALLNLKLGHWAPLESVGYKEVGAFIRGEFSREQMLENIVQRTMALAKKQMTWFRGQMQVQWFDLSTPYEQILGSVQQQLRELS